MEFFKCQMCGGELIITEGTDIAKCSCCGSKQIVPALTERLAQDSTTEESQKGVKKLISQLKSKTKKEKKEKQPKKEKKAKKEKKPKKEKPLSEKKQAKLAKKQAKLQAKEDKKRAKAEAKGKTYVPKAKSSKKKAIIIVAIILAAIIICAAITIIVVPMIIYNQAMDLYNQGNYIDAGLSFHTLSKLNYKDSAQYLSLCEIYGNVTFK